MELIQALLGEPVIAMTRFGGQAELVCRSRRQVFEKPAELSFEQGAALPVNYLTAWALIVTMGGLREDEAILIHNAGGGVGLAALEIARHIGAKTFGTASAGKHEFLRQRGLDHAIDYRRSGLAAGFDGSHRRSRSRVDNRSAGRKELEAKLSRFAPTGRMGVFGMSVASASGIKGKLKALKAVVSMPRYNPLGLMNRNKGVFGLNLGHMWGEGEKVASWTREIMRGVQQGWIRPHVDRTFSFDEIADAHRYIEERKNIGKIVLVP